MNAEEQESLRKRLIQFITQNPGLHVRDIAPQVGVTPETVSRYLSALARNKAVKRIGKRMGSRYFPNSVDLRVK